MLKETRTGDFNADSPCFKKEENIR
jgi:hypothetical protein